MPNLRGGAFRPLNPAAIPEVVARKTVSITQAQDLCHVSRRTIYNWLAAGKLAYVRNAGGAVRIFADTLFRDPAPLPRPSWTR